ncbi:MAG: PAS domain S-box protein [Bacteroidia bacterium]|nr:MAG: PAS domain S-box protein [Bacteroidia bacterium]
MVEAERLRVLGQDSQASEYYDQAISLARENKYLNDEALANELAARFYLNKDRKKIAAAYMQDARYCYLQWGAIAKVSSLDEVYRKLLPAEQVSKQTAPTPSTVSVGSTIMASGAEFDLASIMKVSQAMSSEIVLGNLLKKMMKIVIENAGAQFGYLIMKSGDKLLIEAEGALDSTNITVLQSVPLDECHKIASGIVHYVDRTREYVVLENALEEGHFTHDPYVVQCKAKSILCLPLIHKSNFIGILYLENNAIEGAFTLERLKILRLLSSQIAISLENANLFADLEYSETRYRELYENIIDIVLLVSSEGIISMANPLFYSIFRLHREDTRAMSFKKLVHPEDMAMIEEQLLVKLSTADVIKDLQFRMVGLNNEVFDVECNAKCIRNNNGSSGSIQMVVRDVTDRKRLEKDLFDSLKDAQNAKKGTILGLAKLAEYRDKDTGSHLERIREYARVITEELSTNTEYKGYISRRYTEDIYLSSILHDIGKVGIPDSILLKNGKLTGSEYDVMKRHPIYGGDALSAVESQVAGESFIALGKKIAYYHHEKWNGTGYPYGLKGEDIPLSARIVALVDVYDALTSKRSYKNVFSHERVKKIIFEGKGKHFAPDVVNAFFANENRFLAIMEALLD